jgi:alcohol dehydrogenase class IV
MSYQAFCSTEIVFSEKEELLVRLLSVKKNMVLVMSHSAAIRWELGAFIQELTEQIEARGLNFTWISAIAANPTQEDILLALKQIGQRPVDAIVAIGGGSAIDLAKGISAFWSDANSRCVESITESIKKKTYVHNNSLAEIIAVPTTAGTGSEVTQWATIWDMDNKAKYSIDIPGLQPKLAVIVPELTTSVSSFMTLSTGLDAMCQAIEAYWSKHTTPLVQEIAYRSIELVIDNLRNAVDDPSNLAVRENLCRASVLAGLAFAKTRTTACHSISYPLTMLHDIPHGIAASITLDAVGKRNKGHFPSDQRLFDLFQDYGGIGPWIDETCSGVIDMRLSAFGVTAGDLPRIVDNAFTGGRMDNNPFDLTRDDVMSILTDIL